MTSKLKKGLEEALADRGRLAERVAELADERVETAAEAELVICVLRCLPIGGDEDPTPTLPEAGHMLPVEAPQPFIAALKDFGASL